MSQPHVDSYQVRHHAILIGIDMHDPEDITSLTGCVHDVEEIAKILNESIDDVCIHSLTSSSSPNSVQPTYYNISSRLAGVTQEAQHGDYVYIHYSGHSTVVAPSEPHSSLGTRDMAWVVLEGSTASELRYFHGAELAEHLRDMVDKGIVVTVVLDCCYSGSTLRGDQDETVRYIPYNPEIDKKYPLKFPSPHEPVQTSSAPSASLRGTFRHASIEPGWLVNAKGYAILTSSDATEKAYDVKFGKSKGSPRHGTLTYSLLEAFDMLGGVGGSMQQLYDYISVQIIERRRSRTKKQHPVLFGNNRQLFFGCARPGYWGGVPITRIIGNEGMQDRIQLHAGSAHGVFEHDQFSLHPLVQEETVLQLTNTNVTAEAVNIRGITSDLRIIKGDGGSVKSGWFATATRRMSLRKFPVLLQVSDVYRTEWQEELKLHKSFVEFTAGDKISASGGGWSFNIVQVCEATCEIQDEFKQTITTLTGMKDSERMKKQLLDQLQHLASFKLVRGLTNTSRSDDMLRFQSSFNVVLSRKHGDKVLGEFNSGCLRTSKHLFDVCSHSECVVTITPSERLHLHVENTQSSSLFVYLFAMSCSDWEIEDIMKVSFKTIPPKGSYEGHEVKSTGIFQQKLKFKLEQGQESCEDIVKLFITAQRTSFSTLIMPKLGSQGKRTYAKPVSHIKRGGRESEDWVAVTFRVRVEK